MVNVMWNTLTSLPEFSKQSYIYNNKSVRIGNNFGVTVVGTFSLDFTSDNIKEIVKKVESTEHEEKLREKSEVLAWLLRAWGAEDKILKFVSLFIPLERVIPNEIPFEQLLTWKENQSELKLVINTYANKENINVLLEHLSNSKLLHSTPNKLKNWAAKIRLDGWEKDVIAFNEFIKMRDRLVHAADAGVDIKTTLADGDIRSLEDITKRYVKHTLFNE